MCGPRQVVLACGQRHSCPWGWPWLSALAKKGMLIKITLPISAGLDVEWLKAWIRPRVTPDSYWSKQQLNLPYSPFLFNLSTAVHSQWEPGVITLLLKKEAKFWCRLCVFGSWCAQWGLKFDHLSSAKCQSMFHFKMRSSRYFPFSFLKYLLQFPCSLQPVSVQEHCSKGRLPWGKPECGFPVFDRNWCMPLSNSPGVAIDFSVGRMCFWQEQAVCMEKLKHSTSSCQLALQ